MAEDYRIIPNVNSLHNANISTMYNGIKALNTGGSDNIHMLKNTEWSAAAYLSKSKYGICTETDCNITVKNNNYYESDSYNITTGCGGNVLDQDVTDGVCPDTNTWTTDNGKGASTTHNITGIYDMAGGRSEYVMASMYGTVTKDNLLAGSSGFSQEELNNIPSKFIDKYEFGTNRNILGDATNETANWNNDADFFVYSNFPWFRRGGHAYEYGYAGVWSFHGGNGIAADDNSARASVFGQ